MHRGLPPLRAARPRLRLAPPILAGSLLALFAVHTVTGLGGRPSLFFDVGIYDGLELAAAAALLLRARRAQGRERLAWALLGAAIGLQAGGDVVFSVVYGGDPPFPSPADAFYLASCSRSSPPPGCSDAAAAASGAC